MGDRSGTAKRPLAVTISEQVYEEMARHLDDPGDLEALSRFVEQAIEEKCAALGSDGSFNLQSWLGRREPGD